MDAEVAQSNLFSHFEENVIFAVPEKRPLPVAIVTGFLGSGKTTLLKQLLDNRCNLRVAVISHDLASINMDAALLKNHSSKMATPPDSRTSDGTIRALAGCADCPEFEAQLKAIIKETLTDGIDKDEIDYLVLETSGAADPRRIVSVLDTSFGPCTRARLDRVIAVVDAEDFSRHTAAEWLKPSLNSDAAFQLVQLSCADVVVMNKMDLLDPSLTTSSVQKLEELCPQAHVLSCSYGNVSVPQLLEVSQPQKLVVAGGGKDYLPTDWIVPQQMKSLRQSVGDHIIDVVPALGFAHSASHHVIEWSCGTDKIYLAQLQRFMMSCLPRWRKGLKRAKGILRLHEDSAAHTELHVSGRLRYECRRIASASGSAICSSLVLIFASDFQPEHLTSVRAALPALLVAPTEDSKASADELATMLKATEPGFEILASPDGAPEAGQLPFVRFRLTGRSRFGIASDVDLAEPPYRIDLDALNSELARLVNVTQGASFICTGQGYDQVFDKQVVALLWPANLEEQCDKGRDSPAEIPAPPVLSLSDVLLSTLSAEAEKLLLSTFRNISSCMCGS